jgi:RNA polymerase sigma-70 factor (ECF subfamily)
MTNSAASRQTPAVALDPEPDTRAPTRGPSLRDLFDMHATYVWSTLRRFGVHTPDLEDVTHDVFLQVHRHLAEYDTDRPIRPWLFGFAYRVALQYRRRAHRRLEVSGDPDTATHPGLLPDERAAAQDDRSLVLAALEAIEVERRAVFVLYEIDGVAIDAIATSLGIPANTAYSRLRVARAEFAAAAKRLLARRGGS